MKSADKRHLAEEAEWQHTIVEHLWGWVDPGAVSAALGDAGHHSLCGDGLALPWERLLARLHRHVVPRVLPITSSDDRFICSSFSVHARIESIS